MMSVKNNAKAFRVGTGVVASILAAAVSPVHAAIYDWDGGTASVNTTTGGSANTAANWGASAGGANSAGGVVPTSTDIARLQNVGASGTRVVTVDTALSWNQLVMTQTTAGGINELDINDNLTITGNSNPFVITATAGQANIVTSIAAGKTLLATSASGAMTASFGGTLNLAAGSIFKDYNTSTTTSMTPTFGGPINASGAGAQIILKSAQFIGAPTFSGALTTSGNGSTLSISALSGTDTVQSMLATFSGNDGNGNTVNAAAGTAFNIQASAGSTLNFTNKVALAGTAGATPAATLNFGSTVGNSGGVTTNFNGGLAVGAGANATISNFGTPVSLAATSSIGTGGTLLLQYTGANASATLANSGTFTVDGGAIQFDWAATTSNNGTSRSFSNAGTWTLKNAASLAFISSTGRPTSGQVGAGNSNTGTLSVLSGSTLGFGSLYNTGSFIVGSSTSGVSDALVVIGSPANTFSNEILTNGTTVAGVAGAATLNINGNARFGRTVDLAAAPTATLNNGSGSSTGSVINVGDGTTPITFNVVERNATVNNFAGNTFNLKSNAVLLLSSTGVDIATGAVTFTNGGTLVQSGDLQLRGTFNGARTVTSSGTYQISGTGAKLSSLAGIGTQATNVQAVGLSVSGLLSGATATDKLTYVNSTGNAAFNTLGLALSGQLTPGSGSNGTGLTSVGSLELANTKLTTSSGASMTFDIGGTTAGKFDTLTLGGVLDLSAAGDALNIGLVNGFTPTQSGSWQIIAGTITGIFNTVNLPTATGLTVWSYNNATGTLSVAVPEPGAMCMAGIGFLGMLIRRRRNSGC